ncbi:FAD:protein FMN transferase [Chitinophaga alhagiae]|uniref:FAD:protein FMN transferase n=1 Tax=Chitinophaga alhagiae TaxID=2203219 RepID=UPI000E5BA580|nr:FAD:protein FMN transferase [Chitinophaga alhagiae]
MMAALAIWLMGLIYTGPDVPPGCGMCGSGLNPATQTVPPEISIEGAAQGTTWHIVYTDAAGRHFKTQVDSILLAIDLCLSTYRTDSEVSAFNQFDDFRYQSGHFYPVLQRSLEIYRATNGAFDPTVMPVTEAYRKGKSTGRPWLQQLDSLLQYVGFQYIVFDRETVHKTKEHVRLDFDAIAQGYTVDVIAVWLEAQGVADYMVEVGGEVRCKGLRQGARPWTVGIENPLRPGEELLRLNIGHRAIATAGNYRNFYVRNGQTYRHIIHPKTGLAKQDPLLSATVVAADAITADGFDTALLVMGLEESKQLLQREKDLDACLVYQQPDGSVAVFLTERLKGMLIPQ